MKPLRLLSLSVVALALAMLSGCPQKKPVLVVPKQPPPTAAPQPTPSPTPVEAQTSNPAQEQAAQASSAEPGQAPPAKPRPKRKPVAKKPATPSVGEKATTEVAKNNPKIVVPAEKAEQPAPVSQIAPGPTPADTRDQISTEQLLQNAESNLNGIKRQLSPDEETMRAQIRDFIAQSHKATSENDLARAHTLAVKARLLSDELVKPR